MRRREWLAAALVMAGCKRSSNLPDLGTVPAFEFINQDGQNFQSSQLNGKIWVVDFFFTNCPGPCPRMSNQLKRVQAETASIPNLHLVSITVDPDRDTAAALASYAKRYGAQPGRWTFLTGPIERINNLMSKGFFLGFADNMQQHSTRFVLVDGNGKIRGFYDSFGKDSIDKLIEDIRDLT